MCAQNNSKDNQKNSEFQNGSSLSNAFLSSLYPQILLVPLFIALWLLIYHLICSDSGDPRFVPYYLITLLLWLVLPLIIQHHLIRYCKTKLFTFGSFCTGWLIIALSLCFITLPGLFGTRINIWDRNCKETLYELVSSQNQYFKDNARYGSWLDLQNSGFIDKKTTPSNMIKFYSITFPVINTYSIDQTSRVNNLLVITAIPTSKKHALRTFGARVSPKDYHLYLWVGKSEKWSTSHTDISNISCWEPIR